MKITVIAVGKQKDKSIKELVSMYEKRLPRGVKLSWIEVPAERGKIDTKTAAAREADRIRSKIPSRAKVAALSERGKNYSSLKFARWVEGFRDRGLDLCFLIGGADGLARELIDESHEVVSLSALQPVTARAANKAHVV